MSHNDIEPYIFSFIMYTITLLALIGAIHLIYNICFCQKKCKKCFRWKMKRNLKNKQDSNSNHVHNRRKRENSRYDRDDYDMESETFTSKLCKIVVVSTVIFFLIFLFVGCYQQSMNTTNNYWNHIIISYYSVEQCKILFCMIGFYVYGKMLLYAYFVLRAYNMLEGSHLNYNKTTVIVILSIYFIMMNFILFSMIYVHLTDDYCNLSIAKIHGYIHEKRSIVFGFCAAVDGSMAILSVSLLIYKLFALVRQSMNVHGGLKKITPHPSPINTPQHSQSLTRGSFRKTNSNKIKMKIDLDRIRSISSLSAASSSNNTPNRELKTIKSYNFNVHTNELLKEENETIDSSRTHTINLKQGHSTTTTINNKAIAIRKKQMDLVIKHSMRRETHNDSADDSSALTTNTSAPSSTRPESNTSQNTIASTRRTSASITPEVTSTLNIEDLPELALESILSDQQLVDSDIDKVKKLSIGMLLQKDELHELATKCAAEIDAAADEITDIDENTGFDMIEEDETDKIITPAILLQLADMNQHSYDGADDDDDDDDDAQEWRPLNIHSKSNPIATTRNFSNYSNSNTLRDFPSNGTLQIPSNSITAATSNYSPRNSSSPLSRSPRSAVSAAAPSNESRSKSKSPRITAIPPMLSLSRRSSSLVRMMNRTSDIVANISKEHIRKFHNVTQYDNEILLLSTKLLILLTVCVISSFCSFLLLFGVIRTKQNSAIFFVYGIDSFINVWCLAFTFKFSNKCYNALFNCGSSNRSTKLCFPIVKTAALTWKFCCCNNNTTTVVKLKDHHRNGDNKKKKNKNGMHPVNQTSMTYSYHMSNSIHRKSVTNTSIMMDSIVEKHRSDDDDDEDELDELEFNNNADHDDDEDGNESNSESDDCHMNCCFCCWGNEQEIQIYHMARGEVELMLTQNSKLYK